MYSKRLKNMFQLSSKLTVYIPSTVEVNKEVNNKKYVDDCASLMSECFGGATSTPALGYWASNREGLVKENTTIVFAYCSDVDLQNKVDKIIDYCEYLKDEMGQEAIALEINGTMYFI